MSANVLKNLLLKESFLQDTNTLHKKLHKNKKNNSYTRTHTTPARVRARIQGVSF